MGVGLRVPGAGSKGRLLAPDIRDLTLGLLVSELHNSLGNAICIPLARRDVEHNGITRFQAVHQALELTKRRYRNTIDTCDNVTLVKRLLSPRQHAHVS